MSRMHAGVARRLCDACLVLALAGARFANAQDLALELRSAASQPGDAVVVTVTAPPDVESVSIDAFGTRWPTFQVDNTTWRALLGIDLARRTGRYTVTATAKTTRTLKVSAPLTVEPKQFRRRVLTVAPGFVNPPPDQLARIERDSAFMREVYTRTSDEPAWRLGMTRPVGEPANSSFGTRSVFNGQARSPHSGTDFLSPAGTPIHAPAGGRVVGARDLFFTGNTVVVDHGLGVFSLFAHLSRIDVKEGQSLNEGDVVGLVGATGRVTGPHLHWALRVGTARVDPLSAIAALAATN